MAPATLFGRCEPSYEACKLGHVANRFFSGLHISRDLRAAIAGSEVLDAEKAKSGAAAESSTGGAAAAPAARVALPGGAEIRAAIVALEKQVAFPLGTIPNLGLRSIVLATATTFGISTVVKYAEQKSFGKIRVFHHLGN